MIQALFFRRKDDIIMLCTGHENEDPEHKDIIKLDIPTFIEMCKKLGFNVSPGQYGDFIHMWHGVKNVPTIIEAVKR